MPAEITMPQLSDTMTEGTIVKWVKKEGDVLKAGDIVAEVETDKATMEMETFDGGTLAAILIKDGEKAPVGAAIALIAKAGEKPEDVKKNAGSGAAKPAATASEPKSQPAPSASTGNLKAAETAQKAEPFADKPSAPKTGATPAKPAGSYNYDLIVIGGGPAGYAAAIRAGQLKKRVLCVEKENLGGTCLNWGCIPTKALLESGSLVRKLQHDADKWGISFDNLKIDFSKSISRSRDIAGKLSKGIAHLFNKYTVKHELATATVVAPHKVKFGDKEVTGANILVCTGARARELPNIKFDGKKIISSREAMTLKTQPKKLAIIGAGAIGCEFGDFYSSMGTEVTIIEMMDHLLPIEDEDCSILLERSFAKRGIKILTKSRTESVDTSGPGVKLKVTTPKGEETVEADMVLLAAGVTGNVEGIFGKDVPVDLNKGHIKVEPNVYATSVAGIYAAGDVIGPPWLAHVAHHEAVYAVEKIFGVSDHDINYKMIPGCTYTHPQVASIGLTEKKAREAGLEIKVGKFPFAASGRALAADAAEGFTKLIFDAKYGNLVGAHMIGENVTELLAELVVAQKLEATEAEIIEAMHPHPTMSEAVMEAAGVAYGRAIHL